MSTIRVNKSKDFTVMSNYHLKDYSLSLKTKGLLSYMFSLPDNWDYSVRGLSTVLPESEGTIKTILKELEAKGYLVREQKIEAGGKFGKAEYTLYENPSDNPKYQPSVKNPTAVNCTANISTKQQSTKENKKRKLNELNAISNEIEALPQKNNIISTKGLDMTIVKRQISKICRDLGEHNEADTYFSIVEYYFYIFENVLGEEHTRLSNKAMTGVIQSMCAGTDTVFLDLETYKAMIEQHFTVRYSRNIDYNICHFMADKIRDHRYYETENHIADQRVY